LFWRSPKAYIENMNRKITTPVVGAALLSCEVAHGLNLDYRMTVPDSPHNHSEVPEMSIILTNSISASGSQLFEIYAIVSEGSSFNAVVSAKMLPMETFYTSEAEAETRARELQQQDTTDSIRYSVRPIG
jgi:hypothetical protein